MQGRGFQLGIGERGQTTLRGISQRACELACPVPEDDEEQYQALRKAANQQWDTMKIYYEAAIDAFTNDDRTRASYFLEQGKHCYEMAREADEKSSGLILEKGEPDENGNDLPLDLHAQSVNESIRLLKLHLLSLAGIPSFRCLKVTINTDDGESSKGKRRRKKGNHRRTTREAEDEDIKFGISGDMTKQTPCLKGLNEKKWGTRHNLEDQVLRIQTRSRDKETRTRHYDGNGTVGVFSSPLLSPFPSSSLPLHLLYLKIPDYVTFSLVRSLPAVVFVAQTRSIGYAHIPLATIHLSNSTYFSLEAPAILH
ncbi:hypothetical protein KSP39_PZI014621 [Platanthera zijinensis]|uniref:DUF1771 domain-containing protein n=1 Tax=Platanthera zijinensis TaxID=2320716 RepID=A0AAP0G2N2_9ASPA